MQGFKTEGIILKRSNFGEADRILTVFSKDRGKITVLAKGVRRITSRRSGNVELLNRVVMYLHQAKTFPILTEATSLDTYQKIKEDLTLSTYAYHILELVSKLTAQEQENRIIYGYLVEVLERLCKNPRQIFVRAFEVKTLRYLGFWSTVSLKSVSQKTKELLNFLEQADWDKIGQMELNSNEAMELETTLRYYIEKVIEGELKSRKFLRK